MNRSNDLCCSWLCTFAMTLLLLSAVGCTKDGDFWNLGRRNPNDAGLNVNPDDDRLPLVRTLPVLEGEINWRAELINEGRRKMEAVGWIWSEDGSDPNFPNSPSIVSDNVELGIHEVPVPGQFCNSDVRYRAFATNKFGTALGEVMTYVADVQSGSATWSAATAIGTTTSSISASVILTLSECVTVQDIGICWSSTPNPTTANASFSIGSEPGVQEAVLTGFAPDENVEIRFYAITSFGIAYSPNLSATTMPPGPPTVTTGAASSILEQSATLEGTITDDGGSSVINRGFYLSTTSDPGPDDTTIASGTGTGSWNENAVGLTGNTTYYFRAFATNAAGTGLGNIVAFTTTPAPTVPAVNTASASDVEEESSILNGSVPSDGGSSVSLRGFYLSTGSNPGSDDQVLNAGSGTGSFNAPASNLVAETTYFFRAFATNAIGTATGNVQSFTTNPAPSAPSVSTATATNVDFDQAILNGNVTSNGGNPVSLRGFYLSIGSNPGSGDVVLTAGSGNGDFNAIASDLQPASTYYYRAFATNSIGTATGAILSFTTAPAPTPPAVLTLSASTIEQGSAQLQGEVINNGGSPVTVRGFYLSTDGNPDASDQMFSAGTGTGPFSSTAGNLTAGTNYQFRAFATNALGTSTGSIQSFTTLPIPSPTPIAPINGTTVGCCYFYLDWTCVDGATAYEVQMSTTPDFSGNLVGMPESPGGMLSVGTTMTDTYSANCFSGSESSPQLGTGSSGASGQTFYWRVRALIGGSPGSWSSIASFQYIY